jgi:hypothetical protein
MLNRDPPARLSGVLGPPPDALIDTMAFDRDHGSQLIDVQANVGCFIVISSASVYQDANGRTLDEASQNGFPELPEGIRETQPTVDPGPTTYSTRKIALERHLLDDATTPVTILRPGAIHGLNSRFPREWWVVKRILDRRPAIPLAYRGNQPFPHLRRCQHCRVMPRRCCDARKPRFEHRRSLTADCGRNCDADRTAPQLRRSYRGVGGRELPSHCWQNAVVRTTTLCAGLPGGARFGLFTGLNLRRRRQTDLRLAGGDCS